MAKNPPVIKEGMRIEDVIALLGNNYQCMSGAEILSKASGVVGNTYQFARNGFWIFNHPAGQYLMIVQDGIVFRVDGQPQLVVQANERDSEAKREYFELERPEGDGLCSDDSCPCQPPNNRIPRGEGYLFISESVVEFRQDARTIGELNNKIERVYKEQLQAGAQLRFGAGSVIPILMCQQAAKKRGIDLNVAAADAEYWWRTGYVPLRPTPPAQEVSDQSQPSKPPSDQKKAWWKFW